MKAVFIYITKSKLDSKLTDYFDTSIHLTNINKINDNISTDEKDVNYIFYAEDLNSREKIKDKFGDKDNHYIARPNISYMMENYFIFESWHIEILKK